MSLCLEPHEIPCRYSEHAVRSEPLPAIPPPSSACVVQVVLGEGSCDSCKPALDVGSGCSLEHLTPFFPTFYHLHGGPLALTQGS